MPSQSRADRAPPSWLADGARAAWHELRLYLSTSWRFTAHASAFVDEWWSGRATAMNPLAMMATGAAITAATRQLAGAVLGIDHPDSLLVAVLSALGPYVHYLAIGLLCHAALRPWSSRRAHLTDTIAIVLIAGAGPAAIAEAFAWLVSCALAPIAEPRIVIGIALGAAFSVFCFTLSRGLGALHRGRWWRYVLAFAIALPLTGLAFGTIRPPGYYGLHWIVLGPDGMVLGLGY
jgi:hypothetical protein